MKTYLIVNADDFGVSSKVNEGIIQSIKVGIATSLSLLVNMEGFADALEKLRANPDIDAGVHLNIYRGTPITRLNYLTRKSGHFIENIYLICSKILIAPKRARQEISQEFEAQIKKATENGVKISHLDTDKHIHSIPIVFKIVVALAEKYHIPVIRLPCERNWFRKGPRLAQFPKLLFMKLCCRKNITTLTKSWVRAPEHFYGPSLNNRFSVKILKRLLGDLSPGVNELSCHPGLGREEISSIDKIHELKVLMGQEVKTYLQNSNIILTDFRIFEKT